MSTEESTIQRMYRVGLRAPSGIYFPQGETLTLNNFPIEAGMIDLVFSTNRLLPEGFTNPVRFGLWIDVSGGATSLAAAVETFGNAARGLTSFLSLVANASIDDPTAEVAIETSLGSTGREYWSREVPEYVWPRGFGRGILPQFAIEIILAWYQLPEEERERLFRATVQYHHAIQNWEPGSEIAALSHVWIGMEALTKLYRSSRASELGLDLRQLTERYAAERSAEIGRTVTFQSLNDLDAEIRRRHFFQGDDRVYRLAKDASNSYEHSFSPLWEVREQAVNAVEPAASYLRQAILDQLVIGDEVKAMLLGPLFARPYNDMLDMSVQGELTGPAEALDSINDYPQISLISEPFQLSVDENDDAELGYRTRIVAQELPSGVSFQPTGLEFTAPPATSEGTGLLTGRSQAELAESGATGWEDTAAVGRPISSIQIRDLLSDPIRTTWTSAIAFDSSVEFRIETTEMPGNGIVRDDLLRSAERLRQERSMQGWEPVCVLPDIDERSISVLYRRQVNQR